MSAPRRRARLCSAASELVLLSDMRPPTRQRLARKFGSITYPARCSSRARNLLSFWKKPARRALLSGALPDPHRRSTSAADRLCHPARVCATSEVRLITAGISGKSPTQVDLRLFRPARSNLFITLYQYVMRAPFWGTGGREFKSLRSDQLNQTVRQSSKKIWALFGHSRLVE